MNKILTLLCAGVLILTGFSCGENSDTPPAEQPVTSNQPDNPTAPAPVLPVLAAGHKIKVGDNPISIGHTASPEIVDWNNDGKKDLILGTYLTFPIFPEEGKVMLYLNEGTDEAPVFNKGEFMSAGGDIISVGAG
ncbi:MAG: hypothetical protein GY869_25300 [Planctomycetes bacterium]|nr:hypothetical protein [Planctomycetota bacterium]